MDFKFAVFFALEFSHSHPVPRLPLTPSLSTLYIFSSFFLALLVGGNVSPHNNRKKVSFLSVCHMVTVAAAKIIINGIIGIWIFSCGGGFFCLGCNKTLW